VKAKWNLGYNATDKIKKLSETVCTAMLNSSGEAGDVSNVAAAAVVKMSAGSSKQIRTLPSLDKRTRNGIG